MQIDFLAKPQFFAQSVASGFYRSRRHVQYGGYLGGAQIELVQGAKPQIARTQPGMALAQLHEKVGVHRLKNELEIFPIVFKCVALSGKVNQLLQALTVTAFGRLLQLFEIGLQGREQLVFLN